MTGRPRPGCTGRRSLRWPCAVAVAACLGMALPPAQAGALDALSWLAGCWRNAKGEAGSGEYWQPLAGGTMLGVARFVRGGRTVDHEFLLLHEDEQGRAVYTAMPARQKATAFVATEVGAGHARFENPAHDFPQRIVYRFDGDAAMSVRIEGERQGQTRAAEFHFRREACQR